jgi:hypothetical protein
MPSPAAAGVDEPGLLLPEALGLVVAVGVPGVQALSRMLPAAVEPRINISRRRNLRAMSETHSIYFVDGQGICCSQLLDETALCLDDVRDFTQMPIKKMYSGIHFFLDNIFLKVIILTDFLGSL